MRKLNEFEKYFIANLLKGYEVFSVALSKSAESNCLTIHEDGEMDTLDDWRIVWNATMNSFNECDGITCHIQTTAGIYIGIVALHGSHAEEPFAPESLKLALKDAMIQIPIRAYMAPIEYLNNTILDNLVRATRDILGLSGRDNGGESNIQIYEL